MKCCSAPGCQKRVVAKGLCDNHWHIFRRRGEIPLRTRLDDNEYVDCGTYYEIVICDTWGKEICRSQIDACDLEVAQKHKWGRDNSGYAHTRVSPTQTVRFQNVIIDHSTDTVIDHIDGNPMNNRRSNLRLATPHQNRCNSKKPKNNTSGYKGVYWHRGVIESVISFYGKQIYIGSFKTVEEAARAYDARATELFGEFAKLNFNKENENDEQR